MSQSRAHTFYFAYIHAWRKGTNPPKKQPKARQTTRGSTHEKQNKEAKRATKKFRDPHPEWCTQTTASQWESMSSRRAQRTRSKRCREDTRPGPTPTKGRLGKTNPMSKQCLVGPLRRCLVGRYYRTRYQILRPRSKYRRDRWTMTATAVLRTVCGCARGTARGLTEAINSASRQGQRLKQTTLTRASNVWGMPG